MGYQFRSYITAVDHWIAFVLLGLIGLSMIREALSKDEEPENDSLDVKTMFLLAVATSIDALVVGITFAFLPDTNIVAAVSFIGIITFIISSAGVKIEMSSGKIQIQSRVGRRHHSDHPGTRVLLDHIGIL